MNTRLCNYFRLSLNRCLSVDCVLLAIAYEVENTNSSCMILPFQYCLPVATTFAMKLKGSYCVFPLVKARGNEGRLLILR